MLQLTRYQRAIKLAHNACTLKRSMKGPYPPSSGPPVIDLGRTQVSTDGPPRENSSMNTEEQEYLTLRACLNVLAVPGKLEAHCRAD